MIFHLLDGVQTHVHNTLTSFMAMSFPQVLMTAFPKRPKTTLHISRNIIFHGFSDLDMVVTDKTVYFESKKVVMISFKLSVDFHLVGIRAS